MSEKILTTVKRALILWTGICLVVIGFVSLILPFLPGIFIILFGFSLLAQQYNSINSWFVVRILKHVKLIVLSSCNKIIKYITFRLNWK